jgi:hypothetical protein
MPAAHPNAKSNHQETAMRRLKCVAVAVGLVFSTTIIAANVQGIEALPRDVEMELASSALPAHLQEAATIYLLDPRKGFVVARKGTNGFHALVARTGDDAFRGSWSLTEYPPDVLYPVSFDAAGARAHMQVFLDVAEAQANGTPAAELKRLIRERFRTGHYKPPARAGISYMLAPIMRTYDDPERSPQISTASHPHVMYFAPNVSGKEVGSGELGGMYPHIIMPGPHGLIVQALDTKEKAAISERHAGLTQKLCKLKQAWCLPQQHGEHSD